jgi:hypothetical protein
VKNVQVIVYGLWLAGIALLVVLLVHEGAGEVGLAIARVGWGLLALALYHLLQTLSDSVGWLVLIPKENRIRLFRSWRRAWPGPLLGIPLCKAAKRLISPFGFSTRGDAG